MQCWIRNSSISNIQSIQQFISISWIGYSLVSTKIVKSQVGKHSADLLGAILPMKIEMTVSDMTPMYFQPFKLKGWNFQPYPSIPASVLQNPSICVVIYFLKNLLIKKNI